MIRERFQYRTTFATILADEQDHIDAAKEAMIAARTEIERYISTDPFFQLTYDPYIPASDAPVLSRMAHAGVAAGVGPMAAVAGTIAWAGVEAMKEEGAAFGVIDNGGDIALISDRTLRVGLYAGNSIFSNRYAFLLPPQSGIYGICTSSATVGPSVSLGIADAVSVFSPDVALADAWATSLCNRALGCDDALFEPLDGSGIDGVLLVIADEMCRWGKVPEMVSAHIDEGLISAGR